MKSVVLTCLPLQLEYALPVARRGREKMLDLVTTLIQVVIDLIKLNRINDN